VTSETEKLKAEIARLKTQYVNARLAGWLDGYQHCADTAKALAANADTPLVARLQHTAASHRHTIHGPRH
jgi:hypothetical protein